MYRQKKRLETGVSWIAWFKFHLVSSVALVQKVAYVWPSIKLVHLSVESFCKWMLKLFSIWIIKMPYDTTKSCLELEYLDGIYFVQCMHNLLITFNIRMLLTKCSKNNCKYFIFLILTFIVTNNYNKNNYKFTRHVFQV